MNKKKIKGTTKQIKVRNAVLLVTFAMIQEACNRFEMDLLKEKLDDKDFEDMELIRLYKWLYRLSSIFAKKTIQDFANKRLSKVFNGEEVEADVLVSGLLIFYYYLELDDSKTDIIPPFKSEDIEKVIKSYHHITDKTIKFAEDCILALDPKVEGRLKLKYIFGTHKFKDIIEKEE